MRTLVRSLNKTINLKLSNGTTRLFLYVNKFYGIQKNLELKKCVNKLGRI